MRAVFNRCGFAALVLVAALTPFEPARVAAAPDASAKLDALLRMRVSHPSGSSRVIVRLSQSASLPNVASLLRAAGGRLGRRLPSIASQVVVVPNIALRLLAANPLIERITLDRPVAGAMERTAQTIGARAIRQNLGLDGTGVGVAIIDSGVIGWHDDLADAGVGQRVDRFVDFVDGSTQAHDDYGHGTHVAGIIAGNGYDSDGARTGIAPGARLVVLKVLDEAGRGYMSDVIAAFDYAIAEREALNIRVINLSVASGVHESYNADPLTLAAKRAVDAGIVVVAAAGNNGRGTQGQTQYGGVTSPGNAPWVLTVGASSHMGSIDRADDTIAAFTSRGPTALDHAAKPDIVAPGVGIESLSNPDSTLYSSAYQYLLEGTRPTSFLPYLSLSGTSMAAPAVTGTIALMLQANPSLTPNEIKAILQYTAEEHANYDPLTQGAGFVNARGAVELARHLVSPSTVPYPDASGWGERLIWGNRLVKGGRLTSNANAWSLGVTWGASTALDGETVSWGVRCSSSECTGFDGGWVVGQGYSKNVVWGSHCDGGDCATVWTIEFAKAADDGETVVWGTDGGETVVWGTDGGETVVWGTSCTDSSCRPIIWSR
jgi:serine protease AprX